MSPNVLSIVLVFVSVGTLLLGFQAWRLTSSRSMILITFAATAALLVAAYMRSRPGGTAAAIGIPFMVGMLFAGRGFGTLWRSRKEADLRLPSTLMLAIAGASLYASVAVYFAQ